MAEMGETQISFSVAHDTFGPVQRYAIKTAIGLRASQRLQVFGATRKSDFTRAVELAVTDPRARVRRFDQTNPICKVCEIDRARA